MQEHTSEIQPDPNDGQINASFPIWIGIDVSKDSFTAARRSVVRTDATVFPPVDRFETTRHGVREFMQWAEKAADIFEFGIAMEATGIYSRKLETLIHSVAPEQHVAVCNARSVSFYARSFTEEKSDRTDAEFIAMYACDRNPGQNRLRGKAEKRLTETVRERDSIVEQRRAMENRREGLEDACVRRIHASMVHGMDKAIEALEKLIRQIVESDEQIRKEVERMATAPGVGFLSAAIIYAELGSLKNYTRKQISAMSGVCPVNKMSGTSVNSHAMSRHGSRLLRKILFLDSSQAINKIPSMKEFHARMLGKPSSSKMSAKCACMRKLLLILHAMVVNERDFIPEYKSEKIVKNLQNPA